MDGGLAQKRSQTFLHSTEPMSCQNTRKEKQIKSHTDISEVRKRFTVHETTYVGDFLLHCVAKIIEPSCFFTVT